MTNKKYVTGLLTLLGLSFANTAYGYDGSWEGNHPEAKSEAWTWMGHLQELSGSGASLALGSKGLGFIYYYTRNDEGATGSMDFRSSAVTPTLNGVGQSYETHTLYESQYDNAQLRVRTGVLDLAFQAGAVNDTVLTSSMTAADQVTLSEVMSLYPGLKVAPGFVPTKTHLHAEEEDGGILDLDLYSIWPVLSPADGTLTFLGQAGTFEFASPMQVTVGTYNGTKMAGLSFMDRQWASEYFGINIMSDMKEFLMPAHALSYSHSWSAFHAHNLRTNEWSFFHLWHQYQRADGVADQLVDYSDMLWMKNGTTQGRVSSSDYSWVGTGYAYEQGSEVMLDYTSGRAGFFPSRADYTIPSLGFTGEMRAVPALQSLDQPVPFYEGFASGEGIWGGDPVHLQGRLESSRLLFRPQDYREMLKNLQAQTNAKWQQPKLQAWLKSSLATSPTVEAPGPFGWITGEFDAIKSLMGNMQLKLSIFGEILRGSAVSTDPDNSSVTVYK